MTIHKLTRRQRARLRVECSVASATRPGYARIELEHAPTGERLTLESREATDPYELERLALDELSLRLIGRAAAAVIGE